MDKAIAAVLGAVGALASAGPAHALGQVADQPVESPEDLADVLRAASYADLLRPIPNAADKLRALEQNEVAPQFVIEAPPMLYEVRYYLHHHHHHHHRRYVRHYHHHHHVLARVLNHILDH